MFFHAFCFQVKYLALTGDFLKCKGYVSNWLAPHKKIVDNGWDEDTFTGGTWFEVLRFRVPEFRYSKQIQTLPEN